MPEIQLPGLIVRAQSGFFTVETGEGAVVCQLRGKLKQGRHDGDLAAVGDRVQITRLERRVRDDRDGGGTETVHRAP